MIIEAIALGYANFGEKTVEYEVYEEGEGGKGKRFAQGKGLIDSSFSLSPLTFYAVADFLNAVERKILSV